MLGRLFFFFVSLCAFSWPLNSFAESKDAARPKTGPQRFESEIAAFESADHKNAIPKDPILFVGSSTIRLWQTADAFPGLPVINRGFGGSTIADMYHFADRIVFKYNPRVIVFYSGDNDIAAGRAPDDVFNAFRVFASKVQERLPETQLIFLSIKPSIARWKMWSKMEDVNARVKELASENKQISYIDTAPALLGADGQPQKDLFRDDGLHMSEKGYAAWNALLLPVLNNDAAQ